MGVMTAGTLQRPGMHPGILLLAAVPLLLTLYLLTTPWFWAAPLPALLLGAALVVFNRPAWAFYGILFLIPFGAYRAVAGAIKLDWVLAAAALAVIALQTLALRRLPAGMHNRLWAWWAALLLVYAASLGLSPYPETVQHNLVLLLVAGLFMALGMVFVDLRGYVVVLPEVLLTAVSLGSLLAVVGFVFGIELFADGGDFVRGTGVTSDPNNLALMVIFVMPLLVDRLIYAQRARPWYILLLLFNVAALVSTYSRGGLLVFGFALLMIAWHYRHFLHPRHLGVAAMVVLAAILLAAVTVPASYWDRQLSLAKGTDFALQRRASYLVVGWEAFRDSPVMGHGAGSFRDIYGESAHGAAFERYGKTRRRFAHNSYVELAVGTGMLGLVAYLGMLLHAQWSFRRARLTWRRRGQRRLAELTAGYQISLTVVMIYLLIFSEPLHKFLLLSLALSQVALRLSRTHGRPQ